MSSTQSTEEKEMKQITELRVSSGCNQNVALLNKIKSTLKNNVKIDMKNRKPDFESLAQEISSLEANVVVFVADSAGKVKTSVAYVKTPSSPVDYTLRIYVNNEEKLCFNGVSSSLVKLFNNHQKTLDSPNIMPCEKVSPNIIGTITNEVEGLREVVKETVSDLKEDGLSPDEAKQIAIGDAVDTLQSYSWMEGHTHDECKKLFESSNVSKAVTDMVFGKFDRLRKEYDNAFIAVADLGNGHHAYSMSGSKISGSANCFDKTVSKFGLTEAKLNTSTHITSTQTVSGNNVDWQVRLNKRIRQDSIGDDEFKLLLPCEKLIRAAYSYLIFCKAAGYILDHRRMAYIVSSLDMVEQKMGHFTTDLLGQASIAGGLVKYDLKHTLVHYLARMSGSEADAIGKYMYSEIRSTLLLRNLSATSPSLTQGRKIMVELIKKDEMFKHFRAGVYHVEVIDSFDMFGHTSQITANTKLGKLMKKQTICNQ